MDKREERNLEARIDVAIEQIRRLREDVTEIKVKMDQNFVTRYEFEPYKRFVVGLVSLVVIAVATSVLKLVILGAS